MTVGVGDYSYLRRWRVLVVTVVGGDGGYWWLRLSAAMADIGDYYCRRRFLNLFEISYKSKPSPVKFISFVRFFVQATRLRNGLAGFCTIFRTNHPNPEPDRRLLYDLSYKPRESGARSPTFVRFFVQATRLRNGLAGFCTIFRTNHPNPEPDCRLLYDFSYKPRECGTGSPPFVRFFIQTTRIRSRIAAFCTFFHTNHPNSVPDRRLLYVFSYKPPEFGPGLPTFVRFFIQTTRIRSRIAAFCTIFRTNHPNSVPDRRLLYDFSYKPPEFGPGSPPFVRFSKNSTKAFDTLLLR